MDPSIEDRATPRVRAVVLNHNGGAHVGRCVDALAATEWPAEAFELVVVDNASSDGSDLAIERAHPAVRLIRSSTNGGFPANNLALRDLAGVDYVALVNNDAFVSPGWLTDLVAALEADPGLGAACPKLVFAPRFVDLRIGSATHRAPGDGRDLGIRVLDLEVDGRDAWGDAQFPTGFWNEEPGFAPGEVRFRWTAGDAVLRVPLDPHRSGPVEVRVRLVAPRATAVTLATGDDELEVSVGPEPQWCTIRATGPGYDVINNIGSRIHPLGFGGDRAFLERDDGQHDEPVDVFAWCGGGVLFRRAYLEQTGLFDERFFLYYEDTDLSWRGRAQGWRYRTVPTSLIRHIHAASSGEGSPMFQHYVERNRFLMLLKNAPWRLVAAALVAYLRMVASYLWSHGVRPLRHRGRPSLGLPYRRLRSLGGAARLAPAMLRDRRQLRRRQVVPDAELLAWMHRP